MEKGGREVSILTDESESARVKDSLRILPPQTNLAVISLPALLPDPRQLGEGGPGPHLINPFRASPNWFSRQGRGN